MTRGLVESFQFGRQWERSHVLEVLNDNLGGHLEKCNYKAATDEPCDVCAWAQDTLDKITEVKL